MPQRIIRRIKSVIRRRKLRKATIEEKKRMVWERRYGNRKRFFEREKIDPGSTLAEKIADLYSRNPAVKKGAITFIRQVGERKTTPYLLPKLKDPDPYIRLAIVETLGTLKDSRARIPLTETLRKDTDFDVCKKAAWALGEMNDPKAIPDLLKIMNTEPNPVVRKAISDALAKMKNPKSIPELVRMLNTGGWSLRISAIQLLGEIEDPRAIPHLLPFLRAPEGNAIVVASEALGKIARKNLPQKLREETEKEFRTLGSAKRNLLMTAIYLGKIQIPSNHRREFYRKLVRDTKGMEIWKLARTTGLLT